MNKLHGEQNIDFLKKKKKKNRSNILIVPFASASNMAQHSTALPPLPFI